MTGVQTCALPIYFRYEAQKYHEERLSRKENAIKQHIEYILKNTPYKLTEENTFKIFRNKIFELSDIHGLEVNFFNLKGRLILSSNPYYYTKKKTIQLKKETLDKLESSSNQRILFIRLNRDDQNVIASYSYIKNNNFKSFAILNVPYVESNDFYNEEISNFLKRYAQVYIVMLIFSIYFSFTLSKTITKSLTQISEKIELTRLNQRNEKLALQPGDQEINALIQSYNNMVDELEESAQKLAQSEREYAWREMAKQVAHEIKNPLAGIRGATQLLARSLNDPKYDEFTDIIISEVDRLRNLADTMLGSRQLPSYELVNIHEPLERVRSLIVNQTKSKINIIRDYDLSLPEVMADRDQLIQVMLNICANAVQAMTEHPDFFTEHRPELILRTRIQRLVTINGVLNRSTVRVDIEDNGPGVPEDILESVFYPLVTGRANGTGLGLSIAQNIMHQHNGMDWHSRKNNI